MVSPETKDRVYKEWSLRLGCDIAAVGMPQVFVIEHQDWLRGYRGIFCLYDGTTCVISTPAAYLEVTRQSVATLAPQTAFDASFLIEALGITNPRTIGPAYQGYVDLGSVRISDSASVIAVNGNDHAELLLELKNACSTTEWEHSAIELDRRPILAHLCDGRITAAGSWRVSETGFMSIGIISHPAYRGRGHAKAVVSALTRCGLKTGGAMHYQTLKSNAPSVAIAQALGYEEVVNTLAIRLQV